jgi:hypothetical protein
MTPDEIRNELGDLKEGVLVLEQAVKKQTGTISYYEIAYELAEAWDALERATETIDEIAMGVS